MLPIIHLQRRISSSRLVSGDTYIIFTLILLIPQAARVWQVLKTKCLRCRWISSRVRCAWDAQLIQLFYGVKMFNCYLLALSVIGSDSLSWCCHILGQWEARIPGHVITLNPSGRDVLNAFLTVTMVLVTSAFNLGSVWVATCITGTPPDQIVYA